MTQLFSDPKKLKFLRKKNKELKKLNNWLAKLVKEELKVQDKIEEIKIKTAMLLLEIQEMD